jgi:hypothetical protein
MINMKLLLLILLLFPSILFARTIKVAILDTGLDQMQGVKLCKDGLKDFSNSDNTRSERGGHGNNIHHIIVDGLEKEDFCVYHYKVINDKTAYMLSALVAAIVNKVDIINYSAGGHGDDIWEKALISLALHSGIIVNVAAGNEDTNLDKNCNFFPACYFKLPNFNVVGNLRGHRTNYGGKVVTRWIDGNKINAGGQVMSGSSQSTALLSREILIKLLQEQKK